MLRNLRGKNKTYSLCSKRQATTQLFIQTDEKNVESWFRRLAQPFIEWVFHEWITAKSHYYYFHAQSERIIALCHQRRALDERKVHAVTPDVFAPVFWHLWRAAGRHCSAGKTLYKGGHVAPESCHRVANTIPKAARNYIKMSLCRPHNELECERVGMGEGKWFTGRTWWLWERHTRAHQWKEKKRRG